MAELSDEEVFGKPAQRQVEMSDEQVFGASAPRPMSDEDVGLSTAKPGVLDYLGETGKRFTRDLVESAVASPLRGYGAQTAQPTDWQQPATQLLTEMTDLQNQGMSEEQARIALQLKYKPPIVSPAETPLYRAGEAVTQATSEALPDRKLLNPVVSDIAGGFGSVAGNIITALTPGIRVAGIPNIVAQGAGEAAERAVKAGATPDQIQRAAQLGNVAGATEFADAMLLSLGTTGKVTGFLGKFGMAAVKGAFVEGGQEGLQQFIQNMIAKGLYKPNQELSEDVAYSAMIAAIVGGSVSGVAGARTQPAEVTGEGLPPTSEQLAASTAPVEPPQAPPTPAPAAPTGTLPPGYSPVEMMLANPPAPEAPAPAGPVSWNAPEEPTTPPGSTVDELRRVTIPKEITDFIDKQSGGLTVPEQPVQFGDLMGTTALSPQQEEIEKKLPPGRRGSGTSPRELGVNPRALGLNPRALGLNPRAVEEAERQSQEEVDAQKQEILSTPGANTARLARLLGPKLYGSPANIGEVSIKEMFQNALDSTKPLLESKTLGQGSINIKADPTTRTVAITDNGTGMLPETLGKEFLQIAGTKKETTQASGGFGIAKMLYLYGNKSLRAVTMRNGKVAELNTSGEALFAALDDTSKAPRIQVRAPTSADRAMFPNGHGTHVQVTIPERYADPTTGEERNIQFPADLRAHPVLLNSPLFHNIAVKFNDLELGIGNQFPIEDYTPFANVKFDWGRARIYVEKDSNGRLYSSNAHVLVNGLWQFSTTVKKDPSSNYGENIPHNVYIDVQPRVEPTDVGYPFDLNRQDFAPQARKAFKNLTNYLGLIYRRSDLVEEAHNFGTMQFLDYDPQTKGVRASKTEQIVPKASGEPDPFSPGMLKGDVRVDDDGKIFVGGRQLPELTPQEIEKFRINTSELRVDQDLIDPKRTILHDNVEIEVSHSEVRSVVDYGRERFGQRFYEFNLAMGAAFQELRDVVVRDMPGQPSTDPLQQVPMTSVSYAALGREGIGVSYDQEYRGVSIKIPFAAMFLNPVVPEYTDTIRAAVGMVGTMVHELAHFMERNHNASFVAEMQRILIMLDTNPNFDFHAFKQKVVNIVASYNDIFTHMNGVFTSGDLTIRPRGKRFEDTSSNEARDGSVPQDVTRFGRQPEGGARLSSWVAKSQAIPPSEQRRGRAAFQTSDSRSHRPADNGRSANYNATRSIDPGIDPAPIQPETQSLRQTTAAVAGGSTPELREAASHADRMNWFYKWMAGLLEIHDANPYFIPLRKYVARVRAMHSDETRIHDAALHLLRNRWRRLGERSKNLEALIMEVQSDSYLSPQERSLGLRRHPTPTEMAAMTKRLNVDSETLGVFNEIKRMDAVSLGLIGQSAIEQAMRVIKDPIRLADRIDQIKAIVKTESERPFFPFTHFGQYYVVAKDAAGKVVHFETFEPKRFVGLTVKRAERYQQAKINELKRKVGPGVTVTGGVLPETAAPFVSLSPLLLQQLLEPGEQIGLTTAQIEAIKLLQSQRNPAMSLKGRMTNTFGRAPGYSLDLQRSFARYYFHFGRYYAKTKHAWALRGHITEAHASLGNKENLIAQYMTDHLDNTVLNSKGDFGWFRGAIFFWAMGYVPAAATQNLTQTPMVTLPYLAAKFGDHRAGLEISKALGQLSSFYKRGTYEKVDGVEGSTLALYNALSYGVKTGRISETQAADLAGIGQGGLLISGQGGTSTQQAVVAFQEKAAWMFEMAEQLNRRVAFRAAYNLALKHPTRKFVDESVMKYKDEYASLVTLHGEAQARAIVTAVHTVDQTQYVYARYARPRFMRGPLGATLFVFKRFMQATLLMLGNNKSDVLPRYLVIAMLMGGLGGVPGYDDMKSIFRSFARWFFGKDFNVEKTVRHYVLDWFNGKLDPDLVLHGLARRGFGWPGLMDTMGSQPGRGLGAGPGQNVPFPILDRSRAITMGNILPFDLGKLVEPTTKVDKAMGDQVQKASGAVFSVGFNMFKAAMDPDSPANDFKRWEKAMPRALASGSKSYRAYDEGRERGKGGPNSAPTIVPYNTRDTEQMMEIIALAGGYQPLRVQAKWDNIMAKAEAQAFYDFTRTGLLSSMFEAQKGRNPNEIEAVKNKIIQFNKDLPDYAKGRAITADTITKSMQGRERNLNARETGTPIQRSNVGIAREMDRLYPEASGVIDVRRVR